MPVTLYKMRVLDSLANLLLKHYISTRSRLFGREMSWPIVIPRLFPSTSGRVGGAVPCPLSFQPHPRARVPSSRPSCVTLLWLHPRRSLSGPSSTRRVPACALRACRFCSPSTALCFPPHPPARRGPHLVLSPGRRLLLLQASPEVSQPSGTCPPSLCLTRGPPLGLVVQDTTLARSRPALRAPGGWGRGASRSESGTDCLSGVQGVP